MNFERGRDPIKTMDVGVLRNSIHLKYVVIKAVRSHDRHTNIEVYRVKNEELHEFLDIMSTKVTPWTLINKIWPEYKDGFEAGKFLLRVIFVEERPEDYSGRGYPAHAWRTVLGKYLLYQDKIYEIPPPIKNKL